jgi:hypothetical protein
MQAFFLFLLRAHCILTRPIFLLFVVVILWRQQVHPGTVHTDIVILDGLLGALQRAVSPLLLRAPQAAANVVLASVYGPQGLFAHDAQRAAAHAAEADSKAAAAAAADARHRAAAASVSPGESQEELAKAAKEAAALARAAYASWQALEAALPPAVRAASASAAALKASSSRRRGTSGQAAPANIAKNAPQVDPWLHFANARGQVLGPKALALKSTSRVDQLARALWAASTHALDRELRSTANGEAAAAEAAGGKGRWGRK